MTPRKHLSFFSQVVGFWALFWVAGLPSYYQQYSPVTLAVASILLSVAMSLAAIFMLRCERAEARLAHAFWLSVYYTVPFVVLDALYCGVYLGHGWSFLSTYWYLSVFYVTPWFTFIPSALLLRDAKSGRTQTQDSSVHEGVQPLR